MIQWHGTKPFKFEKNAIGGQDLCLYSPIHLAFDFVQLDVHLCLSSNKMNGMKAIF